MCVCSGAAEGGEAVPDALQGSYRYGCDTHTHTQHTHTLCSYARALPLLTLLLALLSSSIALIHEWNEDCILITPPREPPLLSLSLSPSLDLSLSLSPSPSITHPTYLILDGRAHASRYAEIMSCLESRRRKLVCICHPTALALSLSLSLSLSLLFSSLPYLSMYVCAFMLCVRMHFRACM